MSTRIDFPGVVSDWLVDQAGSQGPAYLDEILARTSRTPQRAAWSSLERWLPVETTLRFSAVPRIAWVTVLIALLALAGVALVVVGSQQRHLPPPFGPARNGTIVYGGADNDIHSLNAATGATAVLIAGAPHDGAPMLSPDGTRFLFLRDAVTNPATDGNAATIMVANIDGTNVRALTERLENIQGTAWSHDGSRVAVLADRSGQPALEVFSADGSGAPVVIDTQGRSALYLAYLPGDRELTFRGTSGSTAGLYAVGVDGRGLRAILPTGVSDFGSLSPDGTKLAYQVSTATPSAAIHVVDVATGRDITPVFDPPTGGGVIDDAPVWSPDGSQLLFRRYHGSPVYRLAVLRLAGGPVQEIGPSRGVTGADNHQFSPDGTEILAYYAADGSTWIIDPAGVAADRQLPKGIVARLAWQRLAP